MKHIPLKVLPDPRDERGPPIDYRDLIEDVIRVPLNRQSGATIEEMRRGVRVLDALDAAADDTLDLEDADWAHLKEKAEAMPWGMVDRRLLEFYDDVRKADNGLG